jgi:putative oxidoreductase
VYHLEKLKPLTLFLFRAALGIFFIADGWPRLSGHAANIPQHFMDYAITGTMSYLVGVLEVFGGGLLILGLFTRAVALLLAVRVGVAVWEIFSLKGYLAVREYEYPLILCTACLVLATFGAGFLSVDQPLFGRRSRDTRSVRK